MVGLWYSSLTHASHEHSFCDITDLRDMEPQLDRRPASPHPRAVPTSNEHRKYDNSMLPTSDIDVLVSVLRHLTDADSRYCSGYGM